MVDRVRVSDQLFEYEALNEMLTVRVVVVERLPVWVIEVDVETVGVRDLVAVPVFLRVSEELGVCVTESDGLRDRVGDAVRERDAVRVREGVRLRLAVPDLEAVCVGIMVKVPVRDSVRLRVDVKDPLGVGLPVGVVETVIVIVWVLVEEGERVRVVVPDRVGDCVADGVEEPE